MSSPPENRSIRELVVNTELGAGRLVVTFRTVRGPQGAGAPVRDVLVDGFTVPLPSMWSVLAINLLLERLQSAIAADRADTSLWSDSAPAPAEYRVVPSRLVTKLKAGHLCLPRNQTIIKSAVKEFLDGDFAYRVVEARLEQTNQEHNRQTSAARARLREEEAERERVARFAWLQSLLQHSELQQQRLPQRQHAYAEMMQAVLGRPVTAQDDATLARAMGSSQVSTAEIGVSTEHWFLGQLRERSALYRPAAQRGQSTELPLQDVQLVRSLRGECDLRVQLASGDWHGLQVKTMSYIDGRTYQLPVSNRWSPNLLVAAVDNAFQHFALLWARHSYGSKFAVTFGVEAATEHTAKLSWKSDSANQLEEFFAKIAELLPQSVETPHWRPAGSLMVENTELEFRSLQFVGQQLTQLGLQWRVADRSDAAYDLVVNNFLRVQVKASTWDSFLLHRTHYEGGDVVRPYRCSDFDFLVVLLPAGATFRAWVIPMTWLMEKRFVTTFDRRGQAVASNGIMELSIAGYAAELQEFRGMGFAGPTCHCREQVLHFCTMTARECSQSAAGACHSVWAVLLGRLCICRLGGSMTQRTAWRDARLPWTIGLLAQSVSSQRQSG